MRVPLRALEGQLRERLARVELYRDLPRSRKRAGWKREFLNSLQEAAGDLGDLSEEEIRRAVRGSRRERGRAEVTVAAEK